MQTKISLKKEKDECFILLHYLPLLLPLHQVVPHSHFPIIPVSFGIFIWQVNYGHQEEWILKSSVSQCSHTLKYWIALFLEKWQSSGGKHACEIIFWKSVIPAKGLYFNRNDSWGLFPSSWEENSVTGFLECVREFLAIFSLSIYLSLSLSRIPVLGIFFLLVDGTKCWMNIKGTC